MNNEGKQYITLDILYDRLTKEIFRNTAIMSVVLNIFDDKTLCTVYLLRVIELRHHSLEK
jgi:hypothetical protein